MTSEQVLPKPSPDTSTHRLDRADFDLINGRGWRAGSIEVMIRTDTLTLRLGNRTLAVFDRQQLHDWLSRPQGALAADTVTWFTRTGLTYITIQGRSSYVVPGNCVEHLLTVV